MFNSGVLDVAVGLSFLFLLLSLICTAVNELIEAKLKMRAVDLERGIRELLGGRDETGLTQKLYEHPLIYSLFLNAYDPKKVDPKSGRYARGADLPSYIPRRNFALALMDIVLPANAAPGGPVSGAAGTTPPARAGTSARVASTAGAPAVAGPATAPLQPLRDAAGRLPNEKLRLALLTLVDAAAGDAATARANIENWFDSAMDRVSGWYKRRVQKMVLAIGVLLAIATNADTITIANSLSRDVSMRSALVAAAGEYAKPDNAEPRPDSTQRIQACRQDANSPECRVARNLGQISRLGLPIGWRLDDPRSVPRGVGGWLAKIIGLLLTAAAISLGAPFWFDVLNKIIVVRSTVKPKEKSPEEPPVDRP